MSTNSVEEKPKKVNSHFYEEIDHHAFVEAKPVFSPKFTSKKTRSSGSTKKSIVFHFFDECSVSLLNDLSLRSLIHQS